MATNRKKATLKYPRRAQFTIQDVIALNDSLNQQTVRNRIRFELSSNHPTLQLIGSEPVGGRGRPRFILTRARA